MNKNNVGTGRGNSRPSTPQIDPKQAGYPSTTGKPSGDGRGNNYPSKPSR